MGITILSETGELLYLQFEFVKFIFFYVIVFRFSLFSAANNLTPNIIDVNSHKYYTFILLSNVIM
jgi:hypothetical protein